MDLIKSLKNWWSAPKLNLPSLNKVFCWGCKKEIGEEYRTYADGSLKCLKCAVRVD